MGLEIEGWSVPAELSESSNHPGLQRECLGTVWRFWKGSARDLKSSFSKPTQLNVVNHIVTYITGWVMDGTTSLQSTCMSMVWRLWTAGHNRQNWCYDYNYYDPHKMLVYKAPCQYACRDISEIWILGRSKKMRIILKLYLSDKEKVYVASGVENS